MKKVPARTQEKRTRQKAEHFASKSRRDFQERRRALPIPERTMSELAGYLEEKHRNGKLGMSLEHTLDFLDERGLDHGPILEWFRKLDGLCDLEIVEYVVPWWKESVVADGL